MSAIRAMLGVLGGASLGYLIAVTVLGLATPRYIGVSIAVTAACVIGIQLIKAIEAGRERQRRYREAVWDRRIAEARKAYPHLAIIKGGKEPEWPFADLKPWPIGDDEVRR